MEVLLQEMARPIQRMTDELISVVGLVRYCLVELNVQWTIALRSGTFKVWSVVVLYYQ